MCTATAALPTAPPTPRGGSAPGWSKADASNLRDRAGAAPRHRHLGERRLPLLRAGQGARWLAALRTSPADGLDGPRRANRATLAASRRTIAVADASKLGSSPSARLRQCPPTTIQRKGWQCEADG